MWSINVLKLSKVMPSCITFMGMMKYKFGSVRREIFIAFAQSGSANSPHSHPNIVWLYLKNYCFTAKIEEVGDKKKNLRIF